MNATTRFALGAGLALCSATIAVSPPLDRLADESFAWHMAQHEILLFAVPLGIVFSEPFVLLCRYVPAAWTARIVRFAHGIYPASNPTVGLLAYVAILWGIHFSPLYEWSLTDRWPHLLEHVMLVATGIIFWIPIVGMRPVRPLAFPLRLLYIAIALPQGALTAVAIDSARAPLYPSYANTGAANALADQRNAAALLWIGGGAVTFVALLATLGVWAAREARALTYAGRQ